jgi:U3 small nucleolar RNA-associated protein 5
MGGKKRPAVDLDAPNATDATAPGTGKKSKQSQGADAEAEEQTLEQRLASLSSSMEQLEQRYASLPARANEQQAPTADSLVTLVDQALQTGDDALLEQCLGCDDDNVVDATARRLPVARVVLLLRRLVSKFEKRPSRSQLLTRWLASILRHHTAYLFSVPDLSFQLPGLSQMLEQRLGTYVPLAGLGGRLDLLMAQLAPVRNAGSVGGRANIPPPNVYVEED